MCPQLLGSDCASSPRHCLPVAALQLSKAGLTTTAEEILAVSELQRRMPVCVLYPRCNSSRTTKVAATPLGGSHSLCRRIPEKKKKQMQILILKHGIGYVAYSADSVRWQERKRAQLPDRARELGITCIKCLQSNLLNPSKNIETGKQPWCTLSGKT